MFIGEISTIILIYWKLGSVGPIQLKVKLPLPLYLVKDQYNFFRKIIYYVLIGVYYMQGWTAIIRGLSSKKDQRHLGKLFSKNLKIKGV